MTSERILFVDDDPVARRSFARAMRQRGLIVDLASDGEEAWELACHFPYAVVATDLRMPGITGMMLIEQIREMQPDTICLLVTGASDVDASAHQADVSVIKKPWTAEQLAAALELALGQYRIRSRRLLMSEPAPTNQAAEVLLVAATQDIHRRLNSLLPAAYQLKNVADAEVAARYLEEQSRVACVVVSDHPGMERSVRALVKVRSELAVVVVGSESSSSGPSRAVRAGAQDWIDLERLSAREVERVLGLVAARGARVLQRAACAHPNPALVEDRLRQAISRARRHEEGAGLLLVQLQPLEEIADVLGEDGTRQLQEMAASRLADTVRESDALLRFSNDTFALVVEELSDQINLERPAERVLNAFATTFSYDRTELLLTVCIGGASFPNNGDSARGLLDQARRALRLASAGGPNQFVHPLEPIPASVHEGFAAPRSERQTVSMELPIQTVAAELKLA